MSEPTPENESQRMQRLIRETQGHWSRLVGFDLPIRIQAAFNIANTIKKFADAVGWRAKVDKKEAVKLLEDISELVKLPIGLGSASQMDLHRAQSMLVACDAMITMSLHSVASGNIRPLLMYVTVVDSYDEIFPDPKDRTPI